MAREIDVGRAVYEQKICYTRNHHKIRVRVYVHDITRRRRAEEAIQQLAKRVVFAQEEEQRQQVMPTRSYLSQVEQTITFGLGKAEQVDKLVVHWTDGTTTNVHVPSVNRVIKVWKQTPPAQ